MKALLSLLTTCIVLLTGCSTANTGANGSPSYQPETHATQFNGQTISSLEKKWGSADQVLHARDGTSYYLYSANAGQNFFNSTVDNTSSGSLSRYGDNIHPAYNGNMQLECTTVFKTDASGKIIDSWHKGNNCGGEWVTKN